MEGVGGRRRRGGHGWREVSGGVEAEEEAIAI